MASGVYGIEYNGAVVYVGVSVNIRRRWCQHRQTLRARTHRNFILQRIFDKHPDGLRFVVLEEVAAEDLTAAVEQAWMDRLAPAANLSAANGSHPHTEAAKAKMRGRVRSEEHRRRMADARRGKAPANKGQRGVYHHTDEARAKIAAAGRGRHPDAAARQRMSDAQRGKTLSPEHREKLAAAKRGKPKPESARLALVGLKQSPETIAKRRASFLRTIELRRASANVDH